MMARSKVTTLLKRWELPSGWTWKPLRAVAYVEAGYKTLNKSLVDEQGTIPLIMSGDLQNRKTIQISRYITRESYEKIVGKKYDRRQQPGRKLLIAVARDTTRGRIGILEENPAIFNSVTFAIIPKGQMRLDYLYYYFLMESTRIFIQERLTPGPRTYTNKELFQDKMPIPVPPMEQGEVLALQDQIIDRIEMLTRDAEEGRDQLFGMRTKSLEAFSSVLAHLFAPERTKDWKRERLSNLLTERKGSSFKNIAENARLPYIKPGSIINNIGRHDPYSAYVEAHTQEERGGYIIENDGATLLYVRLNPEARRATLLDQERAICHNSIFPISVRNTAKLSPSFLLYALLTPDFTRFMLNYTSGAVRSQVSQEMMQALYSYELPLPEPEIQRHISSYLDQMQQAIYEGQALLERDVSAIEQAEGAILEHAYRGEL
jgi:restriction endonuclease S subunit